MKKTLVPTVSNILSVLTFDKPRKVYNGSGYDGKCQAAELNLNAIP